MFAQLVASVPDFFRNCSRAARVELAGTMTSRSMEGMGADRAYHGLCARCRTLYCPAGTAREGHFFGNHLNNWQHASMYPGFILAGTFRGEGMTLSRCVVPHWHAWAALQGVWNLQVRARAYTVVL